MEMKIRRIEISLMITFSLPSDIFMFFSLYGELIILLGEISRLNFISWISSVFFCFFHPTFSLGWFKFFAEESLMFNMCRQRPASCIHLARQWKGRMNAGSCCWSHCCIKIKNVIFLSASKSQQSGSLLNWKELSALDTNEVKIEWMILGVSPSACGMRISLKWKS